MKTRKTRWVSTSKKKRLATKTIGEHECSHCKSNNTEEIDEREVSGISFVDIFCFECGNYSSVKKLEQQHVKSEER